MLEKFDKFDPNQPRDDEGQWTDGGGSSRSEGRDDPPGFSSAMSGKSQAELEWIAQRSRDILRNSRSSKKDRAMAERMGREASAELRSRRVNKDDFAKAEVVKVDTDLGLVFGWAIVSKIDGEPYFDSQGDHIPEDALLKAAADFMASSRVAKEMHAGDQIGDVVFAFPMIEDVAKAMGVECRRSGLMIAMRPSPEVLAKYKSGEYTGFSIGGSRVKDEDVGDD